MRRPKKILSSKVSHKNSFYQVRTDEYIKHTGKKAKYYSVIADPFVLICPLMKNKKSVMLVKVWRYPLNKYVWEFPKGFRDKNETPLMAAKRELLEETSMKAKSWKKLGWVYTAPGISNQKGFFYVADRLEKQIGSVRDEEIADTKVVTLATLKTMIEKRKFSDAASVAAAYYLFDYLKK